MPVGSLVIVGTGINSILDLTSGARAWIEAADEVIYLVGDPFTEHFILTLRPEATSLAPYYSTSKPRSVTYHEMAERLLLGVRNGLRVCGVFYGHPGVFVDPSHEAIRRARDEGYAAQLLPGICAQDSLFADLGLDPGDTGCQSFEATDFLIYRRRFDVHSALVLWQPSVIGEPGHKQGQVHRPNLRVLAQVLEQHYGPDHPVVIYEAAVLPMCPPVILHVTLSTLSDAEMSAGTTLYIPPKGLAPLDLEMLDRLGIPRPS